MKQVAQRPKDGAISVVDVPAPALRPGWLLVANRFSLISAGTERTKVVHGREEPRSRRRARGPTSSRRWSTGPASRASARRSTRARDRLDALAPIGYSSAGVVLEVGDGRRGHRSRRPRRLRRRRLREPRRDRSPSRGTSSRPIPEGVAFDDAAYATVGAIALHGVRQSGGGIGDCGRRDRARARRPARGAASSQPRAATWSASTSTPPRSSCAARSARPRIRRDDASARAARPCRHRRARPRRRAALRLVRLLRPARARRPAWRATAAASSSSARRASTSTGRPCTRRSSSSACPARTAPAATTATTRSAAATSPPATSAGPSSATCRRSSSSSRPGRVNPAELTTHRFPIDDAAEAYRV